METLLAKADYSKYEWRPLAHAEDGAQGRSRLLAGAEKAHDIFNRYLKGYTTFFFAVYVDLAAPASRSQISEASRDAWIKLRYLVPTIASRIVIDENDTPSLEYYSTSTEEVEEWADCTFIVHTQSTVDMDAVRREVGQIKVPSPAGDQTWFHCSIEDANPASRVGFMIQTHHSPFDGNATKILFNIFLEEFARALCGEKVTESLEWGNELDNLTPAALTITVPSEPTPISPESQEEPSFAHPFYATVGLVTKQFAMAAKNSYGLKPREGDSGWPFCRREETLFSKEESEMVLRTLKGPSTSYTVTHLAHAALAMVNAFDNPPTKETSKLFMNSLCLTDCRSLLKEPYSGREGFPGYAIGYSITSIPVSFFIAEDGEPLPLDKSLLVKVMREVRKYYKGHREMPSRLSFMGPLADIVSASAKQAATTVPSPPPDNGFVISSDGAGEKYLDHVYKDASGNDVLSVTKFFTSLNRPDPGPFFRVSSWGGILDLSADFNSNVTPIEDVQVYLARWKQYMLLLSLFTEDDY